jgi:putative transcriptional regulator
MLRFVLLAALFGLASVPGAAQAVELAPGTFLVASRDLGDPNFSETVILLLRYDEEQGAMGLIVNRRGDLPLSRVFEDVKQAKGRKDLAYLGGPVEEGNVLALLKSSAKLDDEQRVFPGVYLISSRELLEKTVADKAEPTVFHVYLGYAGWGPGQLEHELELGAWHIMAPDAASVFDADPDAVWPRLIRRTELRIASFRPLGRRVRNPPSYRWEIPSTCSVGRARCRRSPGSISEKTVC